MLDSTNPVSPQETQSGGSQNVAAINFKKLNSAQKFIVIATLVLFSLTGIGIAFCPLVYRTLLNGFQPIANLQGPVRKTAEKVNAVATCKKCQQKEKIDIELNTSKLNNINKNIISINTNISSINRKLNGIIDSQNKQTTLPPTTPITNKPTTRETETQTEIPEDDKTLEKLENENKKPQEENNTLKPEQATSPSNQEMPTAIGSDTGRTCLNSKGHLGLISDELDDSEAQFKF